MESGRVLSLCLGALAMSAPSILLGCTSGDGPSSGPVVWAAQPKPGPAGLPPAISGGTLLVQQDGSVVAADPDRDVVWFIDSDAQTVRGYVKLQAGDEPGRVVEDGAGRIHVALRRGGALVSIDPRTGTILERRAVCPAPRGIAYDVHSDTIHVACADGLLATFPAAGGAAVREVHPDTDLRDVIVQDGVLYVSRFRTAELLQLTTDGAVAQRTALPSATSSGPGLTTTSVPEVAYRTVALPSGGVAMLHQRAQQEAVATTPGGYTGGSCPGVGVVQNAVSFIQQGAAPAIAPALMMLSLAVDVAVSSDGTQVAVAATSSRGGSAVYTYAVSDLQDALTNLDVPCIPPQPQLNTGGQVIAVAFDPYNQVVSQQREPASITIQGNVIPLPALGAGDEGHNIFHTGTGGGIACASCHPEGGDDGHVWTFTGIGARRTQNLQGGVMDRMPFHWSGDIADMDALVSVVLVGRMGGAALDSAATTDLGAWMHGQPALTAPAPADAAAVARGAIVFNDSATGCTGCHDGPQLSNHQLVDVGTGGLFKVPSLIGVGYRAPYLHDGCAASLSDRFTDATCGGAQHGTTAQLGAGQISDLVAYLQSL